MSVVLLVDLVDTPSEQHPVIIITDQRYESYNPFAHIEERLFDITKRIVITRHSIVPAVVNPKKYKYFTKQSHFDFIDKSKCPDYEMTIRFVRFKITENTYESIATTLSEDRVSVEELKKFIETAFREVKYILGLRTVHSK